MTPPDFITASLLGENLAIIAALLFGLRQSLVRADWPAGRRDDILRWAGAILIAWFGAAVAASWLGFFKGAAGRPPTIELGVFLPIIVGAITLWRSATIRRIVDAVPQSFVVGLQLYRVMGVVFLVLLQQDALPGAFALPAGAGDAFVGLTAPIVALLQARGYRHAATLVLAWNLFGLLDLVVALGTGFLTSPSPLQLLSMDAPNPLISAFPLVTIPVFAVPLAVLLHIVSLTKLRRPVLQHAAAPSSGFARPA